MTSCAGSNSPRAAASFSPDAVALGARSLTSTLCVAGVVHSVSALVLSFSL